MNIYSKKLLGSDNKNNKLPYGTVIYDSAGSTGTKTIEIPYTQDIFVRLVGGGAGGFCLVGVYSNGNFYNYNLAGGSAGMIYGTILKLPKGTYTATIGTYGSGYKYRKTGGSKNWYYSNSGGNTTFLGMTAKGGQRAGATDMISGPSFLIGQGGTTSLGSYTYLTGVTGTNGAKKTGTNKYAQEAANTKAPYSTYGRGGGAKFTGGQNLTATKGTVGYLYIEAR